MTRRSLANTEGTRAAVSRVGLVQTKEENANMLLSRKPLLTRSTGRALMMTAAGFGAVILTG